MWLNLDQILTGIMHVFTFTNTFWLLVGVGLGLFAGTLPGFSGGPMMAIMLPFLVRLNVDTMVISLAGIYAASVYSGSTAGILYNIPGTAEAIPATIEGYQLKQKGRAIEAFGADIGGSFAGATIASAFLILLVPIFLYIVSFFGTAERALFAIWALILIGGGSVTKDEPLKGILSVGFGLAVGMIGQQRNVGTFRYTLGFEELWEGLNLEWLILAVFAIPQLMRMLDMIGLKAKSEGMAILEDITPINLYRQIIRTYVNKWKIILRTGIVGTVIGIVPGIGSITACWAGYATARNVSKEPEAFGKGAVDGVLGAEVGNNAAAVGSFIPLFSLGIPGGAATAIIMGSLMVAGITPGPAMMVNHGAEVWAIMFGVALSGLYFTLLAFPFIKFAQAMSKLSIPALIGCIGILTVMGSYLARYSIFGPILMMVMAILVMLTVKIGLRPANLLIGYILGKVIEVEVIRAYQIGGIDRFMKPTAWFVWVLIILTVLLSIYQQHKRSRTSKDDSKGSPLDPAEFWKDKLLAVFSLIIVMILFIPAIGFPPLAKLWPYVVLSVFISLPCLFLIIKNIRHLPQMILWLRQDSRNEFFAAIDRGKFLNTCVILAAFAFYICLMKPLGFVISSCVFVFVLCLYFDRKPFSAVFNSLLLGVLTWAMKTGFGFIVPKGFWGI